MKTLFQSDWCAFFASTVVDGNKGDFAVPRSLPGESQQALFRRIGWNYFLPLRGVISKGNPDIMHATKEAIHRQIGTVHITQPVHGTHLQVVGPLGNDPEDVDAEGVPHDRSVYGGPMFHPATDGFLTNRPMCVLVVTGADCPPVFIMDPVKRAIALVHSGRAGCLVDIAGRAVQRLSFLTGTAPALMQAVIGPGISAHNYEVGPEVVAEVEAAGWRSALSRPHLGPNGEHLLDLDLKTMIATQLQQAGLPVSIPDLVKGSPCTYDEVGTWHSYRRDCKTGARTKDDRPRNNAYCALLLG